MCSFNRYLIELKILFIPADRAVMKRREVWKFLKSFNDSSLEVSN